MIWPLPTPEEQVQFLRNVQRLLAEGQFTVSYKFALVHAPADLAVLKGDESGAPMEIETKDIAAKFVELYWRQSRPFQIGGEMTGLTLQQNTGGQAEIISHIMKSQQDCGGSLFRLKRATSDGWSKLVAKAEKVVCKMPLWKLQTVGNEPLEFPYEKLGSGNRITLKPGMAYCLLAFYELVRDLIEGVWVRFVQKVNATKLGNSTDLGTFLFGVERTTLEAYRPMLVEVQNGVCLYCRKSLAGNTQVDHFVPWSRYPADLGHNFVLAHDRCNNAKSDFLADESHLAAWVERNRDHQIELNERLIEAALPCDMGATVQIAKWVYEQTEKANGQVWVVDKVLRRLSADWMKCFAA